MSKNARAEFYWKDWIGDKALRLCSLAARGLWMDMLCIAAEADPTGYVLIGSRPLAAGDLARISGATESEVEILLDELNRNGVFSRDHKERIYCRRMVRDEKKRKSSQENGRKGGNPNLRKQRENSRSDIRKDKPPDKPPDKAVVKSGVRPLIPLNHSTTLPQQEARARECLKTLCDVLGVSPATDPSILVRWTEELRVLTEEGFDFDKHILPSARMAAARKVRPTSLNYLRSKASELRQGEEIAATQQPTIVPEDDEGWRARMRIFSGRVREAEKGSWHSKWGPLPGKDGCLVPSHILAEFAVKESA